MARDGRRSGCAAAADQRPSSRRSTPGRRASRPPLVRPALRQGWIRDNRAGGGRQRHAFSGGSSSPPIGARMMLHLTWRDRRVLALITLLLLCLYLLTMTGRLTSGDGEI